MWCIVTMTLNHYIVSWEGIGKSLKIKKIKDGKEKKKVIEKNAELTDVVKLLNSKSQKGMKLKCSLASKGIYEWIFWKPKTVKTFKHLLLYWSGDGSRIEMSPSVLSYEKIKVLNNANFDDILGIAKILPYSNDKWKLKCTCSTKGTQIWTFRSRIQD